MDLYIRFIKSSAQLLSLTRDTLVSEQVFTGIFIFISRVDRWLTLMSWIVRMGRTAIQTLITYICVHVCGCMHGRTTASLPIGPYKKSN